MTLAELDIGKDAIIESVVCEEISLRKHILDMGLTPGVEVTLIKTAPMGDPLEIRIRGYELTLRKEDAAHINLVSIHDAHEIPHLKKNRTDVNHPQTGEMGIFHVTEPGEMVPDDEILRFGLAGNQNCGKTTLFNQLTGSNQHVGNFPGVTVDRKDGVIKGHENTNVTDLPGIYSLSPYTGEEIVSRDFLMKDKPHGVINIVDATNIERNLYLTMQVMELNIPMVLALNMMDEMRENGGTVHVNRLEEILGIPVVPIVAAKGEGIDELVEHALHVAKYKERPGRIDFCDENGPMAPVHRCIHAIEHMIEDHALRLGIPVRFAATKLVEDDDIIMERLSLSDNEKETLEHIITEMEKEMGTDRQAALADMRFTFIERVCEETVVKPHASKEYERSVAIDRILTGRYTAIPAFIIIMAFIFWMTFGVFGTFCSDMMEAGIDYVTSIADNALSIYGINEVVHSLVIKGIFAGVGSVLSFLPTIVILFFFLSILEDSGYMARIAFIMDKLVRKMGLSGRSFVPMLIGFGCSVPAIMSTRTLPSERDRKMTIMLTPFMSCSAKMPIYAFFTAAFFARNKALVMVSLYFTGIVIAIIFAKILSLTKFKGTPVPFVMELPNYRFPGIKNVLHLIYDKAKDFITKAFTIIFVASIIIWFLRNFDMRLNITTDSAESLLAMLGNVVAPLFVPLGFADWKVPTALITGFVAKESVVSTLTLLIGEGNLSLMFTPFQAVVFLVFSLLYTPCVAAIAAVKRELGKGWAVSIVLIQCIVAWVAAFLVYILGTALGFA